MDKRNIAKCIALVIATAPLATASATTFERPGTWCYQADAGPEAMDLRRFLNCAWNHAAGFDTDETPFAFLKLRDIMVLGRNDRVRFQVCGFPGTGAQSNGDCGWVDVDVVYQNGGTRIVGQVPLIQDFISMRDDMAIPLTSAPNDIKLKITMPDGRQMSVDFSVLELRKPETRADGLAFSMDHALYGLDEFVPGSNSNPTPPPDPTVHGNPGHTAGIHSMHCLVSGDNAMD